MRDILSNDPPLHWVDVLSTDDWALEMIPTRVHAVVLVYPTSDESSSASDDATRLSPNDATVAFCPQTIRNACGTIALVHALRNVPMVRPYATETSLLHKLDGNVEELLKDLHHQHAQAGDTDASDTMVTTHYVCLVHSTKGRLMELNGREQGPLDYGESSDLLRDACARVIAPRLRASHDLRFAILALAEKEY